MGWQKVYSVLNLKIQKYNDSKIDWINIGEIIQDEIH
jgi:hypothetical protein